MSNEKDSNSKIRAGVLKQLDAELNERATAPLTTIADCYAILDVFEKAPFEKIQLAYRHQLYKYNQAKAKPGLEDYVYYSKKLPKVKEAYLRICKLLQRDPGQGLVETKDSLIRERDKLLKVCKANFCGTHAMRISQEYDERIGMLESSSCV